MKRRDLEKRPKELGWYFLRAGGNHDVWTNGVQSQPVPRHGEINEFTARAIIKNALGNVTKGN